MSSRTITIAVFAALTVAAVALHLLARRPSSRVPRLGDLIGVLVETRRGRVGLVLVWWWLGWHFFAR
ncbi:MAG TPA: DUF6186 family protein [Actinomycetes bacterium]|jgi:hypothetical protein|nr:DUF6186 family protein [Actinomycetes bacterium]